MRQRAWYVAVAMLASVLAGCGAGTTGHSTRPCRAGALALGYGPRLIPMTEEHGDWYKLINRGPSACVLDGYPTVTLYRKGGTRLRFHYTNGPSQFITGAPPHAVVVRPGASAWVLIAKNSCILRSDQSAAVIRITLPGQRHVSLSGRAAGGAAGVSDLDHCHDPHDPGQTVAVSPIEPTRQATTPLG